tara:strand:- start:4794 stop:5555 length:762 start_codon:yes stop_codon:yes gene_type:complete
MSVEAPNNIKFQSLQSINVPPKKTTDPHGFRQLFETQSSKYEQRPDHSPKSPKNGTFWMEYPSADQKNIEDALSKITSLKQDGLLKFTNIKPNQLTFSEVLKGVEDNSRVKHLIIRQSSLSDHHIQTISKVLQLNDGIAWLVLDHNKIDDRGVRYLAHGLANNLEIKHVVLADNDIGDDGAVALSQSLKHHPNVESLWLQGNDIGDVGAESIINMIEDHPTLRTIDIRDNQMSESKKNLLIKVCEKSNARCYA